MTCVWDGIIKKLTLKMSALDLYQFVLYNNTIVNNILWNGNELSHKQKIENYDRIKEIKNIQNGYDCSTCDPLLIFIAWKYEIDIIHYYNGVTIYYTHNDSDFLLPSSLLNIKKTTKLKGLKKHNKEKKKKYLSKKKYKHSKHSKQKKKHHHKEKKKKHNKEKKKKHNKEKKKHHHKEKKKKHKTTKHHQHTNTKIQNDDFNYELKIVGEPSVNTEIIENPKNNKYKCVTFYSNSHHFW